MGAGERDTTLGSEGKGGARGMSFWQAKHESKSIDLITHDDVAFEANRARWSISSMPGEPADELIESKSPAVSGFLHRMVAAKVRIARRKVTRPPVPKPVSKAAPVLPPHTPVPCPLCRPRADADHPGEAWADCEVCDGAGVVTAREADDWGRERR